MSSWISLVYYEVPTIDSKSFFTRWVITRFCLSFFTIAVVALKLLAIGYSGCCYYETYNTYIMK